MTPSTSSTPTIPMVEKDLQHAVEDLVRILGGLCAHFRPAQTGRGYRTAVSGDGKGFPDCLILTRSGRLLVRELKVGRNKPSPEQQRWLDAFIAAGIDADVWTEHDLPDRILEELRR